MSVHRPSSSISEDWDVIDTWCQVGVAITHLGSRHYLTLIDCGPTRFPMWHPLFHQDSASVIRQLESIFFERGPPTELLVNNAVAFCQSTFINFREVWSVHLHFRCAHFLVGNAIIEKCYLTIKCTAARKQCSVEEAVYLYNIMPKDNTSTFTAPENGIYIY